MIEEPLFYAQMKENIKCRNNYCIGNENNESSRINYKMVVVVRKDLKMGEGKIAAQVGHGGK